MTVISSGKPFDSTFDRFPPPPIRSRAGAVASRSRSRPKDSRTPLKVAAESPNGHHSREPPPPRPKLSRPWQRASDTKPGIGQTAPRKLPFRGTALVLVSRCSLLLCTNTRRLPEELARFGAREKLQNVRLGQVKLSVNIDWMNKARLRPSPCSGV